MKDSELKNKVVEFLLKMNSERKSNLIKFTPAEICSVTSGSHTRIGFIAKEVEDELRLHGVNVKYIKNGNNRFFEISK